MIWQPTPELRWFEYATGGRVIDEWGFYQPEKKTVLQQKWVSDEAIPQELRGVKITMKKYEWRAVPTEQAEVMPFSNTELP
jgi:hypothetical protein